MTLFRKYQLATLLLSMYYIWWIFLLWRFLITSKQNGAEDGFPQVVISIVLMLICSAACIVQIIRTREQERTDYMLFLGLVKLPAVIGFFFLASYS